MEKVGALTNLKSFVGTVQGVSEKKVSVQQNDLPCRVSFKDLISDHPVLVQYKYALERKKESGHDFFYLKISWSDEFFSLELDHHLPITPLQVATPKKWDFLCMCLLQSRQVM